MDFAKPMPTQEYLHECFDYDSAAGVLTWKHRPVEHFPHAKEFRRWNTRHAYDAAGGYHASTGRMTVCVDSKVYEYARVVWKLVTGFEPKAMIDHEDGNPLNNSLSNLREATRSQNIRNARKNSRAKLKLKGVDFHAKVSLYRARIKINGKETHLGYFKHALQAYYAYCKAALTYYGEFARLS